MKSILFVMICLMISSDAKAASWQSYNGDEDYFDTSSIRRRGSTVEVWTMANLRPPIVSGGKRIFSALTRYRIDCDTKMASQFDIIGYSELNAGGTVLSEEIGTDVSHIPPGTRIDNLYLMVCRH